MYIEEKINEDGKKSRIQDDRFQHNLPLYFFLAFLGMLHNIACFLFRY